MADLTGNVAMIRGAVLGVQVREALASGIEVINYEVVNTADKQSDLAADQEILKKQFTDVQANTTAGSPNSAEIVASHTSGVTGEFSQTIGARMDKSDSQLANKAQQVDLLVEKARITNLSTLVAGSTTGDAELIDTRIGTDGLIYSNAGGAIRGQINLLKDNVDEATYYPNLKRIWHEIVTISSTTGKWLLYSDFESSLLEINSNDNYTIKNYSSTYGSSFAFLKTADYEIGLIPNYATGYTTSSPINPDSSVTVKAPSDSKYLWISTAGAINVSNYVHIEPYSGNCVGTTYNSRFIASVGFSDQQGRSGWVFPVSKNKKYKIISETGKQIIYALLSSIPLLTDTEVPFSYDGRHTYIELSQLSIIIPQSGDTQYVWVAGRFDYEDYKIKVYDMGASDTITIASVDSGGYREDADFICDGINDQIELQAATDSLTNGGTISLLPGNFYIDAFDTLGRAIITGYNNGNARTINYMGTIQNKSYNTRFGTTIHVTNTAISSRNATIKNAVFVGIATKPAVSGDDAQFTYTYVNNVNFNNFYLYTSSAFEGFVGIDCTKYGSSQIKQVCVATEDFFYNRFHHIKQTTPGLNSIGISSCNSSNDEMALTSYEDLDVGGMYIAYQFNGIDHLVMMNCFAARNVYGFYFTTNYKTQTMINCADEGNYHAPYFKGSGHITMIDFCVEPSNYYPDDVTGTAKMKATEETAGGWKGSVTYTGQGYKPFWANGSGINVETKCLENSIVGVTMIPEYLQKYFDTTNNVWHTWNGSAWV